MRDHNTKSPIVDLLQEGLMFRWLKQLALRGKARNYNERGVCNAQKLVYVSNHKSFIFHAEDLFPGAHVEYIKRADMKQTLAEAFMAILKRPHLPQKVTQEWLGQQLGRPWREVAKHVMRNSEVLKEIERRGLVYRPGKGRRGSCFERLERTTALPKLQALAA
jgi:hypothetical protein